MCIPDSLVAYTTQCGKPQAQALRPRPPIAGHLAGCIFYPVYRSALPFPAGGREGRVGQRGQKEILPEGGIDQMY